MSSSSSNQRFADYFVICGLDTVTGLEPDQLSGDSLHISPLKRSYKAKVLEHFPSNVEWNPFDEDAVRLLSLPQGLHFKKQSESHEPTLHSFLITREDGTRVYGCTLTFYEVVTNKQICEAMQTLHDMHEAELNIARSKSRIRSRSPLIMTSDNNPSTGSSALDRYLETHFDEQELTEKSSFNLENDVLMVSKCVSVITPLPFISACGAFLEQMYKAANDERVLPLPLESYIYNLLYEVPLPPPGRTMRFKGIDNDITCQRPGPNELPLFDYSLKEMFTLLGVENIVEIFTCVLLEYQILLLSNSYKMFMLVAEGITNLIFPFVWQHVYVPILPATLKHFLDAPVPFLMGLYCETEKDKTNLQLPSEASLCLVDIDNCKVTTPEDLPEFPNKQDLISELKETIEKFKVQSCQETPVNSRPNSEGNSLDASIELMQNTSLLSYSSASDTNENESGFGSASGSPRNSRSNSPINQRKQSRESPKFGRKDKTRERPRRAQVDSRALKSKSATSLDLSKNPRLQAIAAIAERTGIIAPISSVVSNLEKSASDSQLDAYTREEEDMFIFGEPAKEISRKQQHENEFNTAIREIFANRFTQLLIEYESFVIQPTQDFEQWTSNREQMQNFDKASFLSDQPTQFLSFLSPFTETQMFASFIDMKILANWEDADPSLAVFDQRVENMKNRLGVVRSPSYEKCMSLKNSIQVLLKRSNSVDYLAVAPHHLDIPKRERDQQLFGSLYGDALLDGPQGRGSKVNWKKRSRQQRHSEHVLLNTSKDGKKMRDKLALSLKKFMQESKTKTGQSQIGDMTALETTQNAFIQKLLKECRQKTKRMLVQKMGQEAVDLGHTDASVSGVEENTLIASLCDLLERVFSHGLQTKEGKSSLWSHLLAYQCLCESNSEDGPSTPTDSNYLSPGGSTKSVLDSPSKQLNIRRKSSAGADILTMMQPMQQPSSALADMKHVQTMSEIKTDIGHARAWARLSLEKKVLSKHLKQIVSDDRLLRMRYKDYAFLRTEEEREQFLYHLLSLNAVDFFCFTNCFTSTAITYKVVIKTGKQLGGGSTTANAWMTLAGHVTDTGVMCLPKNENEFRFKHSSLGVLTTLRIGHDNSGLSPGWFIEQIVVRNEVTEHIYRFPCGRWLAKNVDDGSTERLLVAELIKPKNEENTDLAEICRLSPSRRSPVLSRRNRERTRIPDVQEKVADSVNNIVKYFYKPDKERDNLTYLLCGDGGLCQALEQVFQCGFKSSRLFRNNFFIWDILEKAHQYLQMNEDDTGIPAHLMNAKKTFCTMITRINNSSQTIGKDGKFQIFVCLGARDHLLHNWLELISICPAATNMYDTSSFFRDSSLVQFLVDVLAALIEFNISLEASLLKGIS